MVVKVAIDLALDRLFDYEVPQALQKKLAVGQLLSVPFGHREARGFALALADKPARDDVRLKPVNNIVDDVPFFSEKLLELVKKVAAYTCSPLESVLKAALPASVMKKNARAQELLFIEPAMAPFVPPLSKRQEWLYAQIVRLGGGWMSQLCRELKTTPNTIRELGRLGLVKVDVRAKRRNPLGNRKLLPSKPLALNAEQQKALNQVKTRGEGEQWNKPILLHGITGSGKTEVYLQAIAAELEAGRGAIVLVPEISLTPQTVQRFSSRFGDRIAVLHSALSDGERYDEWHRIRSGEARVVVGPRSAVWAPVKSLGLIVVDEEHESSYKQDEMPRYHARDVAVLRGAIENARVVLGSATPSLESWLNVKKGKYLLATMAKRAGAGTMPAVRLVDMAEATGGAIFSRDLLDAISLRLKRGEQTILFLNRRGYSRQVVCEDCGGVISCPKCSTGERALAYTYHRADSCLRCHVCGGWIELPKKCPHCASPRLTYRGIGTQRAEAALKTCFAEARVLRMDADSTSRKNSHDDILAAFRRGEADILIGTQMIAKGLDFPNVTLVGVLNADSSLNMPDFRASERTFQLLAQVSGRAGRAELPGEVLIQTHDPLNSVLKLAAKADFATFATEELKARAELGFPPYAHLALVTLRSKDPSLVAAWAKMYSKALAKCPGLEASEDIPSAIEKADDWYRRQIVLRSASPTSIIRAWRWLQKERPAQKDLRTGIDIDAINIV